MAPAKDNPYVGPRTFREDQAKLFFGREREARDLLSLVISERLVLFYARSGAGKSSLINTRLRPWLKREGFFLLPTGRVSGSPPEDIDAIKNIFVYNLLVTLDQSPQADTGRYANMEIPDFLTHLTTRDGESYYYDDETSGAADDDLHPEPPHVLIIDQFEELLLYHPERWEDRGEFFRQLNQAMVEDPMLWVVLSLREDYVAPLDPFAPLLAGRMRDRFYMQRLEYEAALAAVQEPAVLRGRPFAPGVAEGLVDNLRQVRVHGRTETGLGQFVEPVQLQIVCYQLWERLREQDPAVIEITEEILEDYDVDQALTQFYGAAIGNVARQAGETEARLREWVEERLITEAQTRGTVHRGESESAGLPTPAADLLVDQFLLRTENRAAATWYELVHDRFIDPILRSNAAWRQSPTILSFEVEPKKIRYGEKVHLRWHVEGADEVFIDAINWDTKEPKGDAFHKPERNTVYVLRAVRSGSGAPPAVSEQIEVIVTDRHATLRRSLQPSTAGQESMWETLIRRIVGADVTPIISNSLVNNRIFDIDYGSRVGQGVEEKDKAHQSMIDEQLATGWAEFIKYPLAESPLQLSRVAQYNQVHIGYRDVAKTHYLTFLKMYLLQLAMSDELVAHVADTFVEPIEGKGFGEIVNLLSDYSFSEIAFLLGYPRYEGEHQDPLHLLAQLPFPIYVTTSHHDFLERALMEVARKPIVQVCSWFGEEGGEHPEPEWYGAPPEATEVADAEPTEQSPLVYHLYGLEKYPSSIVISEDDYMEFLVRVSEDRESVPVRLRRALVQSSVLLLGYRLHDWDFRVVSRMLVKAQQTGFRKLSLAVLPDPDVHKEIEDIGNARSYLEKYFESIQCSVEWGTVESFAAELWQRWQQWSR